MGVSYPPPCFDYILVYPRYSTMFFSILMLFASTVLLCFFFPLAVNLDFPMNTYGVSLKYGYPECSHPFIDGIFQIFHEMNSPALGGTPMTSWKPPIWKQHFVGWSSQMPRFHWGRPDPNCQRAPRPHRPSVEILHGKLQLDGWHWFTSWKILSINLDT